MTRTDPCPQPAATIDPATVEHYRAHRLAAHRDARRRRRRPTCGLGRRGRGLARRRRRLAAPPRAHRRRPHAVPQREHHPVPRRPARRCSPTGALLDVASALLGEPAVLYKEKVNYKLPGGAGYAPHQDAPAYPFVDDPRVVHGRGRRRHARRTAASRWSRATHHEVLPMDDTGCIRADVVDALDWEPVEVPAGPDPLVPLAHPAPQRPEPLDAAAAGALPDLQRAAPRATSATTTTPRSWPSSPRRRHRPTARCRCRSSATSRGGRSDERRRTASAASVDEVLALLRAVGQRPLRRGPQPARPRRSRPRRCGGRRGRAERAGRRRAAPRRRPPARARRPIGGRASRRRRRRATAAARARGPRRPVPRRRCSRRRSPARSPCTCAAKRYLLRRRPGLHVGLSLGSGASLVRPGRPDGRRRGGRASSASPARADAVALRRWDDAGKVIGAEVAALERYRSLLDHVATPAAGGADRTRHERGRRAYARGAVQRVGGRGGRDHIRRSRTGMGSVSSRCGAGRPARSHDRGDRRASTTRFASPSPVPAIRQLLGYDPQSLVGQDLLQYLHPDEIDELLSKPRPVGAAAPAQPRGPDPAGPRRRRHVAQDPLRHRLRPVDRAVRRAGPDACGRSTISTRPGRSSASASSTRTGSSGSRRRSSTTRWTSSTSVSTTTVEELAGFDWVTRVSVWRIDGSRAVRRAQWDAPSPRADARPLRPHPHRRLARGRPPRRRATRSTCTQPRQVADEPDDSRRMEESGVAVAGRGADVPRVASSPASS